MVSPVSVVFTQQHIVYYSAPDWSSYLSPATKTLIELTTRVEDLHPGDTIEILLTFRTRDANTNTNHALIMLYDPPCYNIYTSTHFCTGTVLDDPVNNKATISLTLTDDIPVKNNMLSIQLPLYIDANEYYPLFFSVYQANRMLTPPNMGVSIVPSFAFRQLTLSSGYPGTHTTRSLLFELAVDYDGEITISGIQVPDGIAEVEFKDCGSTGTSGIATVAVAADTSYITIDDTSVQYLAGSKCIVLLPQASSIPDQWLYIKNTATPGQGNTFPANDYQYPVYVTADAKIGPMADLSMKFFIPRVQLPTASSASSSSSVPLSSLATNTPAPLFAFTSNIPSADPRVECTATSFPSGAVTALHALITATATAAADDADDLSILYTVEFTPESTNTDPDTATITNFSDVVCFTTMHPEVVANVEYAIQVTSVAGIVTPFMSRESLGFADLAPTPSILFRTVDSVQMDIVFEQIDLPIGTQIVFRSDNTDNSDIFTALHCDDTYVATNSTSMLTVTKDIPFSFTEFLLRCSVFISDIQTGTSITFPHQSNVAPVPIPVFPLPSPVVTLTGVSHTLVIAATSYETRGLVLRLSRPADKRRVARVWAEGGCDTPITTYIADLTPNNLDPIDRFMTEFYVRSPQVDPATGIPTTPSKCTFFAEFMYAAGTETLFTAGVKDIPNDIVTEAFVPITIPLLESVLPNIVETSISTSSDLAFTNTITFDNSFKSQIQHTDAWTEFFANTYIDPSAPFFLPDGSSVYSYTPGRLYVIPHPGKHDTVKTSIAPRYGAWPVLPSSTHVSLYVDGVEYPGNNASPPATASLVLQQPALARSSSAYILRATFAAPAVRRATLTLRIDVADLPWTTASCSIEGLPVLVADFISPHDILSCPISMDWSRPAHSGVTPLPLPHATVICAFTLESNRRIYESTAPVIEVWVRDSGREVARGRTQLQTLTDAVMAVRFGLDLERSALKGEMLDEFSDAIVNAFIESYSGVISTDQISLISQTHPSRGHTLLTFEIVSEGNSTVTVDGVRAIVSDLVTAALNLGYDVAGDARNSVSGRLVDATCAYQCGSGCSPCADGTTCTWALDCSGGECRDGVCRTPSPPPVDLTWLWAAIAGLVCVVCGFVIYKLTTLCMTCDCSVQGPWYFTGPSWNCSDK
jgi:hypothetical protein